ncbi:MAG: hypothetical protein A2511_03185 [Deltaproteobacteria bacterium RIFOXYD12_FULL_50_9]|nr:MAG: hypothetical protein A2511_03185 [Deltaproteobacteria bacterium RIFOXYD12_FULL_50_9]
MPEKNSSKLGRILSDPGRFCLTFELVPSRGGRSKAHSLALDFARRLAADGRIQAVSITENAGGHAALSPEVLGKEIRDMGLDVIVHFSCKDKNRNQMESLLFAWDRIGLHNLLVITGDYPKEGYRGVPKPVFDLGSVHALDLISRMNQGIFWSKAEKTHASPPKPTSFLKGVAVSPFKHLESELMMQYFKLHRKLAAGADYVITQVGFDARKFHELLLYIRRHDLNIPMLGNVFVPNMVVAGLMHRGEIPGCVIPDALYAIMQQEAASPDKGKKARLIRAAKLLAVLKGMGYSGAHIGGPGLSYDDMDFLLTSSEHYAPQWRELIGDISFGHPEGFYYFEKDAASGLNLPIPTVRSSAIQGKQIGFILACHMHQLFFNEQGLFFSSLKSACLTLEESRLAHSLDRFEHLIKFLGFGCRNCGDCTLAELAFLCPQAGCAKYLLNGPCGGSCDGWCEVYPGKRRCFFVRVYERLKSVKLEDGMAKGFVPPRNWALNQTSSWVNFFERRDHTGADK